MLLVWKVPLNNTATTSLHASLVSTCCASLKALLGYVDRKSYIGSCSQWLKIGREVSKICSPTDRNKQTYPVRISVPSPRRGSKMCLGVCRHGCNSSIAWLRVTAFRLTTVGRRIFLVAASLLCNSLPSDIQSSPSLPVFCQRLKHSFFASLFLI